MSSFQQILSHAVKHGASDVHLSVGSAPACRIDGEIRFFGERNLTPEDTDKYLAELLNPEQIKNFNSTGDVDLAYSVPGLGRFRVNILKQRGSTGIVMRHVKGTILGFDELHLPPTLNEISEARRGLVLVTGTTGSGKSTTLAAIVDKINEMRREHIVTLDRIPSPQQE